MFIYFLLPHWVPATWRSLAQTSIRAELPSGKLPTTRVRRGNLDFDLGEKAVYFQGKPLKLTRSEYAICEHLAMRPGQIFSKEQLYEAAFGYEGLADSSAITEHIKNIRAKLRPLNESPIKTVWGVGYKWKKE